MRREKISITLPVEDLDYLRAEVAKSPTGKSNMSHEVHVAILQNRIAKLPPWKRKELFERLGVKEGGELPPPRNETGDLLAGLERDTPSMPGSSG
jgi:hypothetical protein